MHAFDWKTLVNILLTVRKMVPNRTKHNIFYALYERQKQEIVAFSFQENACFQPLTPVNTLLYTGKMPINKRKTSRLQWVNRVVNVGRWFVYLHLPRRKTTLKWNEYLDSPMRKRTENVGFSVRKTWVKVCKKPRFPWIQSSFSVRWTLVFLPWFLFSSHSYCLSQIS